ncbi:MAG: hypothetical protein AB1726_14815 [Planctomycetota bacterium]
MSRPILGVAGRWAAVLFVVPAALVFPLLLLGLRPHTHGGLSRQGAEALAGAGIAVRLDPDLGRLPPAVLQVGGIGFLTMQHEIRVAAAWGEADPPGATVHLRDPAAPAGWRLRIDFRQPAGALEGVAALLAGRGDAVEGLSGTILVSTLDWRSPGPKGCAFALHSGGRSPRCFRGAFSLELPPR